MILVFLVKLGDYYITTNFSNKNLLDTHGLNTGPKGTSFIFHILNEGGISITQPHLSKALE